MKVSLYLFASLLLAVRLFAADPATTPRRPAPGDIPNRPQAGMAAPAVGMGAFDRVLYDEQRQKLSEYTQASAEKSRTSQMESLKLRRELQESVMTGEATDALIKEKSEAIAKLDAEVLAARMSAMAKIAATLTPEQKEKIKEMGTQMRATRPGLGAGPRDPAPPAREPAAPPPPAK